MIIKPTNAWATLMEKANSRYTSVCQVLMLNARQSANIENSLSELRLWVKKKYNNIGLDATLTPHSPAAPHDPTVVLLVGVSFSVPRVSVKYALFFIKNLLLSCGGYKYCEVTAK